MPTYSFRNNDTGEEWDEFFSISGKEEFLKENDHIVQLPSLVSIVSDVGGIKNDGGWKDNMSRIAEDTFRVILNVSRIPGDDFRFMSKISGFSGDYVGVILYFQDSGRRIRMCFQDSRG